MVCCKARRNSRPGRAGSAALSDNSPLTLWDADVEPALHRGVVYRWNGYSERCSVHSLLRYVDTHGDRLRQKYLAWIHDLGEARFGGKSVVEHLALEEDLSFWWMTLLAEKSPWKSPAIVDAIRIFALEEILVQQKPGKLYLVSANRELHRVLSGLCQRLNLVYEWEPLPYSRRLSLRSLYRAIPAPLRGLITVCAYVWNRWALRQSKTGEWFDGQRSLFVCSYFFNLISTRVAEGQFQATYWGSVNRVFRSAGYKVNWLQLYHRHEANPDVRTALQYVRRFNEHRDEQGFHVFLDAYLSIGVVLRVLRRWFLMMIAHWRLSEVQRSFSPVGSQFSLWPIMRRDWQESLCGSVAVSNLLWIELFDGALCDLPRQHKGLYLCENQAWERALIHAWRKYEHGILVGVAHATMRFWDLRYFSDQRTMRSAPEYPFPRADLTAVNGKAAVDTCLAGGYTRETIVEVEALRYGYLDDLARAPRRARVARARINVLILSDFLPSRTMAMMRLLEAANANLGIEATYAVKAHPDVTIRAEDYPSLRLRVVTDDLGTILPRFDVAYASNVTSAAVEAHVVGLPVVVMLPETELNFSPLRGQRGIRFVSTPEELVDALQADEPASGASDGDAFFYLDPDLPRWQRLLTGQPPHQ